MALCQFNLSKYLAAHLCITYSSIRCGLVTSQSLIQRNFSYINTFVYCLGGCVESTFKSSQLIKGTCSYTFYHRLTQSQLSLLSSAVVDFPLPDSHTYSNQVHVDGRSNEGIFHVNDHCFYSEVNRVGSASRSCFLQFKSLRLGSSVCLFPLCPTQLSSYFIEPRTSR